MMAMTHHKGGTGAAGWHDGRRLARRGLAAAGLALLGACQAQTPVSAAGPAPVAPPAPAAVSAVATPDAALMARIQAGIGEARCSGDAQCRTLAIGEKACGGPERWLAWSLSSPQAAQLPAWAAESSALARQRNARSGMLSNCLYQPDPGARCLAGRCVIGTPALAR